MLKHQKGDPEMRKSFDSEFMSKVELEAIKEKKTIAERLWRSVKYEEVYIKDYRVYKDTRNGLGGYFPFYNNRSINHWNIGRRMRYIMVSVKEAKVEKNLFLGQEK